MEERAETFWTTLGMYTTSQVSMSLAGHAEPKVGAQATEPDTWRPFCGRVLNRSMESLVEVGAHVEDDSKERVGRAISSCAASLVAQGLSQGVPAASSLTTGLLIVKQGVASLELQSKVVCATDEETKQGICYLQVGSPRPSCKQSRPRRRAHLQWDTCIDGAQRIAKTSSGFSLVPVFEEQARIRNSLALLPNLSLDVDRNLYRSIPEATC